MHIDAIKLFHPKTVTLKERKANELGKGSLPLIEILS